MSKLKEQAIAGVKWTTVATTGRSVFQILQIAVLTRFLPKEAFGIVTMALFVVQLSEIFVDMGVASAILHKQDATQKEYSSIYWLNIFISLVLYAIVFFAAPFVAIFYKEPQLSDVVPIIGLNLLFIATGSQHRTIMQKQFEFKSIALIELSAVLVGLITAVYLAINNYGVYSLVYSTLAASFMANTLFLLKNIQANPISFHFKWKETIPFLKIGGFSMGSRILDFFSREIDVLIIGRLLGAANLGIYSLAKQVVLRLYNIINPTVTTVLIPLLSSIQEEKDKLKESFTKVVKYMAYINAPIYLGLIVLSREILAILYGEDYTATYMVLSLMAFTYYLSSIANPVGSLQIATGRTDLGFKWTILRLCLTLPAIYWGSLLSVEMVAGAYSLLAILFIFPLWYILIYPTIQLPFKSYFLAFYKPMLLSIFVLALHILYPLSITNLFWIDLILKGLIILSTYIVFVFLVDRSLFREISELVLLFLNRDIQ